MNPIRILTSWLGRPTVKHRRGLGVECLEDRLTPSITAKSLSVPVDLSTLSTTQDLLALTTSANPLNDLANVVSYLHLGSAVDVADSSIALTETSGNLIDIHLQSGVDARTAAATMMTTGLYSSVSPNYVYPQGLTGEDLTETVPNDPQYSTQYEDSIINAPAAWSSTLGSPSVIVAVLDDGIDINHADLSPNIWTNPDPGSKGDLHGWNFVGNNNNVLPDDPTLDPHGTEVAGVLAARIDNGVGLAGIDGDASIMPLKVIGNGPTTSLTLVSAINYAIANGAKIINSSINIDPFANDPAFMAAVQTAYDKGLIWVNSAGNLNLQDPTRDQLDDMLIVSATDNANQKASYSNYGSGVDISAPGGTQSNPLPTTIPGGYSTAYGSSLSAALVSGTAALVWSEHPTWTRDEVVNAILANTDSLDASNPDFTDMLGTGQLDAGQAVSNSSFVTQLGPVIGLPAEGEDAPEGFSTFSLRLDGNLDPSTVIASNFELRWAGPDNTFDTADDEVIPLTISNNYEYGTNSITFTIEEPLQAGLYRFTAISGGLTDPFGTPVDGDGDGVAGGDLVRFFGNPLLVEGHASDDLNGDGAASPGEPGVSGVGAYPDLSGSGQHDVSAFPNSGGPIAIPDNATTPAVDTISVSGFTQPVEYITVQVQIVHPDPADLEITLIAPTGQEVTLFQNSPVDGIDTSITQVYNFAYDVPANTEITANSITRNLNPEDPFSSLYGISANGNWQVVVTDTTPGDSGTLISASLTLSAEPLVYSDANGNFGFNSLPAGATTIRIVPPPGWEVSGSDANPAFVIGKAVPDVINVSLVRSAGIVGQVLAGGSGVGGFTVFLDANGDGVLDDGEASTTTDANGVYDFDGLAPGTYTVRVLPLPGYTLATATQTAVLTAASPLSSGNDFTATRDTGPVQVTVPPIAPTLRTTPVDSISFSLSEPVDGLQLSDLQLTRDGVNVPLTDATLIGSGTSFTLIGIGDQTTIDGYYTLTISAPAPAGEPDRQPAPAVTTWTLDTTPPTATLTPNVGANGIVNSVAIDFSTAVSGVDLTDFTLLFNGTVVSLASVELAATASPMEFVLSNLAAISSAAGQYTLTLNADSGITDIAGNPLSTAATATWTVPLQHVYYTAVGAGAGSKPTVKVFDSAGNLVRTINPFDPSFTGGVRVAVGDVNGDGVDDIIVAAGPGGGPRVSVYDGTTGLIIEDFFAFEPTFTGGVFVSAGDLTGDGKDDIIVSPDNGGGPRVRVLNGMTAATIADFYGIDDPSFRGGVRTALGDVTGDGTPDLIVSAGTGGGPRIAVYDGKSVAAGKPTKPFGDFFAFNTNLRNGAYVAALDIDGDGKAEIVAAAGAGGGPQVTAFSGAALMNGQLKSVSNFFVGDPNSRSGLRVSVDDDELFVGPGVGGSAISVYSTEALLSPNPAPTREFDPFGGFLGGVYLG